MTSSKSFWALLTVSALACAACGDDTGGAGGGAGHEGGGGHGSTDTSTSTASAGGADGVGGAGGAGGGEAAVAAPVLDEVMAMHGALHLYWTNVAEDCDEVEGERMTPDSDFEVFFTVPGTVDNEADDAATDPATEYTYRLRCRRGEVYSAYSNELSASPE